MVRIYKHPNSSFFSGFFYVENFNLFIRRHPTEENKKFKNFNSRSKIKITLDNNKNLINSLRNKFVICGHNSMAMVIGKICGLKTININIQNVYNCRLINILETITESI